MSAVRSQDSGDQVALDKAREVCPTSTRRQAGEGALVVDVRDRDLIMVCAVGERSLKATYFLMYHGHGRVANMEGGIAKWIRKGFPFRGDADFARETAPAGCCGTVKPARGSCCG
jgi:rhodanese-related sulfurtransferase